MATKSKTSIISTENQITEIFYQVYNDIQKYNKKHNACSNNIIFNGCIDYNNIVKLEQTEDKILLSFSKQYLNNPKDKIQNVLKRYILTTNKDNSFKAYWDVHDIINKLKLFTLLKTFQYNYLHTNTPQHYNCFCIQCFNPYYIEPIEDIQKYRCICGGKIHHSSTPIRENYNRKVDLDDR